jgi:hypothetical protein
MSKARFLAIFFLLFSLVSSVFAQEEIGVGDTVEGEEDSDAVEYELELEEDQTVQITLESDDFDTYLELYDDDGNLLDSNDDFDGTNSQITYTADDDMAVIVSVRSFGSDGPNGDYELSVEEIEIIDELDGGVIEFGDTVSLEPNGASEITLTFEGTEGQAVSIFVESLGDEYSSLSLEDPDGDEIASNDDSGLGWNPAIRRFALPATGTYTIILTGLDDSSLFAELEVTLEESAVLLLNDGPQTLELDEDVTTDVVVLDVVEDTSYLISVSFDSNIDSSFYLRIIDEDLGYARSTMTLSGTTAGSFVYEAEDDGRTVIEVELFTFSGGVELTVTAEALQ